MGDTVLLRDVKFDIARCLCMIYVIAIFHLTQYLGDGQEYYLNNTKLGSCFVTSALGVFSLISGYFIGLKYSFMNIKEVRSFYKKRLVRFYPLFFISAIALWIIDFNSLGKTICALTGIACFVPVELRPNTLWYISMLMVFYLITPTLVGGGQNSIKNCNSMVVCVSTLYAFS